VWNEFTNDPERLRRIAQAVMAGWTSPSVARASPPQMTKTNRSFLKGESFTSPPGSRANGSLVRRKKARHVDSAVV